ncbi:hypothetical protein [Candidatus Methanoplasma termitum]|nr:hypothetical protein [Candidatus Methanoplasma termitum]
MSRKDIKLPDGFSYFYYQCPRCSKVEYTPQEAQRLMDYARDHQFLFVSDWILAWLYVGDGAPVSGIIKLQKQIFVILYEFAQENDIPSENPGFRAYKFGPYTEAIDRNIASLMDIGLVESRGRTNSEQERFFLTEKGKASGKEALDKLTPEQMNKLKLLRADLQQFDSNGIMTYIYTRYPEFTDESIVFERTLHRRRK